MRQLCEEEKFLIERFAEKIDGAAGVQLRMDAAHATANPAVMDGSRILFEIADYQHPPYHGQHPFAVEGRMLDSDNTELSVLLHADENGRLLELEFMRWDSKDLLKPQWNTLKIF